jgi:hemerythrin superfamily protein
MNTVEIKKNLHKIIDSIENEAILFNYYKLLKNHANESEGALWSRLSKQEQDELLLALEESEESDNLISHADMKKKHAKWL